MIKNFTRLQELWIKGVYLSSLMPQILNTHQLLNPSLKALYVKVRNPLSKFEAIACLSLLAILCPALMDIATPGEWLAKEWLKILEDGGSKIYGQRLGQVRILNEFKAHL